jgi:hypothetical protein
MFKNTERSWNQEEDDQLNKLYNEDKLDIMDITKINNRSPGLIISRLLKYKYIINRMSARGYATYKKSDLYKEIVSNNIEKKTNKQEKKQIDNALINNNNGDYIELHNDVKEIKNEIIELKNTINQLVEMMKTVYEFEDTL